MKRALLESGPAHPAPAQFLLAEVFWPVDGSVGALRSFPRSGDLRRWWWHGWWKRTRRDFEAIGARVVPARRRDIASSRGRLLPATTGVRRSEIKVDATLGLRLRGSANGDGLLGLWLRPQEVVQEVEALGARGPLLVFGFVLRDRRSDGGGLFWLLLREQPAAKFAAGEGTRGGGDLARGTSVVSSVEGGAVAGFAVLDDGRARVVVHRGLSGAQ